MDKSKLLAARTGTESGMPEADVDVPGLGTVRVRGLSRFEVMVMKKSTDTENIEGTRALVIEQKLLSMAMLDPVLTEDEVKTWQKTAPPGELDAVSLKVQELSGLLDAPKSEASAT